MSFLAKSGRRSLNADVDESLFGLSIADTLKARKHTPQGQGSQRFHNGSATAVISSASLSKLISPLAGPNSKEISTITARELFEIQQLSNSARQSAAEREAKAEARSRADLAARAKARKDKMLKFDETHRKPVDDEFELSERRQRAQILGTARSAVDESHDDVKHMNQIMLYAQCVTVRDAQLMEKHKREQMEIEEEKRKDEEMERERVRLIEAQEIRERQRAEEQREGARVIIKQIQEREQERIREQEQREQEAQQMLEKIKELEVKEEMERKKKIEMGKKLLAQVVDANNEQAKAKLRKKQEEMEEELRIAEYLKYKEMREYEAEMEKERIKNEKEKEIARLRALQEKAQDRQSQIDELRAKRYMEQKDRKWRAEQLAEAEKKEQLKREIHMAREMQQTEKARRIAELAVQEREDHIRILEWQQSQAEMERERFDKTIRAKDVHKEQLKQQIEEKEAARRAARRAYLEEGKGFERELDEDRARLMKIKQEKLEQLEKMGVPEKYRAELMRKKMLVAKIH